MISLLVYLLLSRVGVLVLRVVVGVGGIGVDLSMVLFCDGGVVWCCYRFHLWFHSNLILTAQSHKPQLHMLCHHEELNTACHSLTAALCVMTTQVFHPWYSSDWVHSEQFTQILSLSLSLNTERFTCTCSVNLFVNGIHNAYFLPLLIGNISYWEIIWIWEKKSFCFFNLSALPSIRVIGIWVCIGHAKQLL